MVLFDEDPVTLISETTNQFHIAPDKESLTRLSSNLAALASTRLARLDRQHAESKNLARHLHSLKSQHEYEQGRRDTGKHAGEILALDGEKFRIAKAVSEAEMETEKLASELNTLKKQLGILQAEGVEGGRRIHSKDSDERVLKLHVYRSLGIELPPTSKSEAPIVVRNTFNTDLNLIKLDNNTKDPNVVWECM